MIATLISRIFDPFLMFSVVFVILFWGSAVFISALLSMVILPFVLFIIAWKTKFVSNWDVSNRQERPKILWTLVGIEIVFTFVFHLWSFIPILAAFVGFALISHFWKISGHVMSASLAVGMIIARFGWDWWPVLFIVPLLSWARVVTKNHTIGQVIAGAIYSWVIILLYEIWKSI